MIKTEPPSSRLVTADPMSTVQALAEGIGPRGSTSRRERRAAEWVAEQMVALGLAVTRERFQAVPSFSYTYGALFALFVGAAVVYRANPLEAVLLCFAALVLLALEASYVPVLTRVLPQGPSQNIVGRLEPRGPTTRTLVLTAHLDTSRSALLWHPRVMPHFRTIFQLVVASMAAEFVLYSIGLATHAGWVWPISLVPALILALAVAVLVDREFRFQHSPGANDNASGVAVMLAIVQELAHVPLAQTEVWAVATGCEESGPFGIARLLEAHRFDRATTFFLNLDNIGAGRISYVTGEGMLFTLKADTHLVELARAAAEADSRIGARAVVYKALPTDNTVTLTKGYRGMSLMAFDPRGLLPNWHWRTDTAKNVEPRTLARAVRFATEIIRRLDAEA